MKKTFKKAMSVVLALAMVMGLSVFAGATTDTTGYGSQQTSSGEISSEGNIPADAITLTLPTAAENADIFSFILDPDGLIQKTNGARYVTVASGTTLDQYFSNLSGHLFFKNSDTTYSGSSNSVKITNKSNVPVKVNMTTALQNIDATQFVFSDNENFTYTVPGATADADPVTKEYDVPAFYMVLKSEATGQDDVDWTLPTFKLRDKSDNLNSATAPVLAWNNTDEDAIAAVNALKDDFNEALAEGLSLKVTIDDDGVAKLETPPTLTGYVIESEETSYNLTSTTPGDRVMVINFSTAADDGSAADLLATLKLTFKKFTVADPDNNVAGDPKGSIRIAIAAGDPVAADADEAPILATKTTAADGTETFTIGAELNRKLNGNADAYELKYDATSGYSYKLKEGTHTWPSMSFHLEGEINDALGWDKFGSDYTIAVTWQCSAASVTGNPAELTLTTPLTAATGNGAWTIQVNDSGMTKVKSVDIVGSTAATTKSLTVGEGTTPTAGKANYAYDATAGTITVYLKGNNTSSPQTSFKNTTIVLQNDDGSQTCTLTFDATTAGGPFKFS